MKPQKLKNLAAWEVIKRVLDFYPGTDRPIVDQEKVKKLGLPQSLIKQLEEILLFGPYVQPGDDVSKVRYTQRMFPDR